MPRYLQMYTFHWHYKEEILFAKQNYKQLTNIQRNKNYM